MSKLYRIINFKRNCGSCGGSLVQFQQGDELENALPFSIGKVLMMYDIEEDDVRGNHAHYETEEILVVLRGSCTVVMDDGRGTQESVRLEVGGYGSQGVGGSAEPPHTPIPTDPDARPALLLHPHVWRVMKDFSEGTQLLVVANMKYDEADYIRDRTEFERAAQVWGDLGGSSISADLDNV